MRLDDSYLRCIVYIGWPNPDSDSELSPSGTGFLVSHENFTYIVTAAHVAALFTDCPFGVRLFRGGNKGRICRMDEPTWIFHSDKSVDVAVLPFEVPDDSKDVVGLFPTKHVISEFKRETKNIGPGDLAYVVGVFKKLYGDHKNVPFVHTGHIASMADGETVRTHDWNKPQDERAAIDVSGYMVQVNTLEGSSGSPVFVRRTLRSKSLTIEHDDTKNLVQAWQYGSVWLLGLWHGQFESGLKDLDVNVGMGICIPATRIIEVLNCPELKRARESLPIHTQSDWVVKTQSSAIPAESANSTRADKNSDR